MTNTNKELDWDNPGAAEAEALFLSPRGGYIVGQALYKAIEVLSDEDYPEHSNIADMRLLMSHLYPVFAQFQMDLRTAREERARAAKELEEHADHCAKQLKHPWGPLPTPTNKAQRELQEAACRDAAMNWTDYKEVE